MTHRLVSGDELFHAVMDDLSKFAEKIMSEHGVENYDINLEGLVGKGENYLGEVLFFNIAPKNGEEALHFVRKKAKYIEDTKEDSIVRKAYQRESYMYKVVFPEMKNFLRRQDKNIWLDFIPKVYYIVEEAHQEMLIFKNMKYSGYQLLDRRKPLSYERVSQVLKTLSKFHALSFAMKELEPITFQTMTESLTDIWKHFASILDAKEYFGKLLEDVLDKLASEGREDLKLKFKPIVDDIEKVVYTGIAEEDKLIVCHNDSWANNMLFKVDERESNQPVCLIDYQISSLGSPVTDLSMFLLSAGDRDILKNIEEYLKMYHDYLADVLESLDVNITDVFPYEKLKEHWKKYAKAGFVVSLYIIQASLSELEEVPDDLTSLTHTDSSEMKNASIFRERVNNLLINFGEKFL